ncbi:uncharacterized protein LOC127266342 [Andrographis paniculata]|uniref:uncharacterized protein LOC127266342 n=1 Tax=Andrographis paniculata TaxID=175694 RepID=UPI0021E9AC4A|nr:uncharacterized protein LOC127266342 [Andrographis paniculata]
MASHFPPTSKSESPPPPPPPTPIQSKEDDDLPAEPTTALLSFSTDSSSPPPPKPAPASTLILSLIISTCLAAAAVTFAVLFFHNNGDSSGGHVSRPLAKLRSPVVLLISTDGFRFGYQFKTDTPNIHRLIRNGIEAELGLIPVFPTLTFPNHYSIVTGLYPAYHGIVNNYFTDPTAGAGGFFHMASHEPEWWLGEPLWETAARGGLKAAVNFWPGSEVKKGVWNCPKDYCLIYNASMPYEERVDKVLNYFDLPPNKVPSFITLYFDDPDTPGHKVGPDDPRITAAISRVDAMIGRLIRGLEDRGVFEDVSIVLLGDHGMVSTCDRKLIFLSDLSDWIDIPKDWVQSYSPLLAIRPPPDILAKDIVVKMNKGLKSVTNGQYLKIYLKEDLPPRLHYVHSDRIAPIIGLLDEGFKVEQTRSNRQECGGAHGYDNSFFSMRSIFVAHGPRFGRGLKVPSFENVEIYNLVTAILNITGAPNNGTSTFPDSVLLPEH